MAIIPIPAGVRVAEIEWNIDRPSQQNRSGWTGTDSIRSQPWHGRWDARVTLATTIGQNSARPLRSFLLALDGRVNSFRVPAVEADQHSLAGAQTTYGAHAAGVTTILTKGWTAGQPALLNGEGFTLNDQLVFLTQDWTAHAEPAARYLIFKPPLRKAAAGDAVIETKRPWALVAMASSRVGWGVGKGQTYTASFDVEERF